MRTFRPEAWLPTTKKEVEAREWDYIDVILFSGDAYVDHPSFGAAVIGRTLEAMGLRVAIVPQPDWRGDYRDFKKLGAPRLFFGVSAGAMDSMINHYTANKRLRSDDAYTPDRRAGMRPDYPSIVYTKILKEIYPDVPVVLGGIEASLRRVTHYDYWQDKLLPGILKDSPADLLIYGMGELPLKELVSRLQAGTPFHEIKDIRQTAYLTDTVEPLPDDINLFSHEECLRDKLKQAKNFKHIEEESNKQQASRILQKVGKQTIVVNPPFPPMTEEETMEAANYIFQQGKRLESLSFKLLELIVTDKQQYQFRMISVERLVNEAVRLTREKREERKIALHLGLEEGEIFGERDLLLSVLVNLLDNSRKAVRTGGRIQILGRNYGKTYELCISDNGCGMDAGESQRITEAFYMIDKSRARREGGAGLGMTLCSRILALHHVRWKIFSKPGKGTVIVIRFHCEREATDDE